MSSAQTALRDPGAPARLAGWLTLARISNAPTVVSDVLAGAAIAGAVVPGAPLALLAVAMVLFYTAGMLLNDVCDYRWDLGHRPDRPLVVGLVSRRAALAATVALFAVGSGLLWLAGPRPFVAGLALIGLIALYDAWHKSNPLSPLVMALCRLMVYVTAFAAFAWPPTPALLVAGGLLVLYLVGLTAVAKSEVRPAVVGYWPAVLLLLPPVSFAIQLAAALPLALVHAAWVGQSLRSVYRRDDRRIGVAIARLIAGISLVDAMVLAVSGASLPLILVAVGAFGLTSLLQRYVEGT